MSNQGPRFVHLNVHTEYSLIDGLVRVKSLANRVRDLKMPAVAVTEHANLFSLVKFYRAAQEDGIKPIVGIDVRIYEPAEPGRPSRCLFLCRNTEGYRQLAGLTTRMYTDGQVGGRPLLQREWLSSANTSDLIALSGGVQGDVGRLLLTGRDTEAQNLIDKWQELFPDRYYLEIQRTGQNDEDYYIEGCVDVALKTQIPLVATNDVRFIAPDDYEAHEARVCIHDARILNDARRPRNYSPEQYLKSPDEMVELFADLPEAIENTVEIAKRCNLELNFSNSFLPIFPVPEGRTESEWFEQESRGGLDVRLGQLFCDEESEKRRELCEMYHARLTTELDVINKMGFSGYFLIVADFINWARKNGVPVGPGRGSGAGSLVAYSLGITGLDPIKYDLLFERFLNPERVSLPDFDVDFCMDGRDRVIEYVTQRYGGHQFVAQIITFGTMAARAVVRDVGRVLGHPYPFVDQIAKLVPFELGITLERALAEEELLLQRYQQEEEVRLLIDLALKLEGVARNAGRHAGGVVIAPSQLTDFTALYGEQGSSSLVTQLDKDDVESVGLVKFDFLGLRTLTIIDRAVAAINKRCHANDQSLLDIGRIPLDDESTYKLIRNCATTAVFQFESRVMKELVRRLQPENFDDIIALNALVRPGPAQLADEFINRKHGRSAVTYLHPELEPVLKSTYGVILYQEQVMQIAQVLAGYTLGGADLLRRAMGKKKPEEMAKQRSIFVSGAESRGVAADTAMYIFDLMEKFAGYGFNKSHSAAYALIAVQTAWLKTHFPAEFMAAVLSSDMDHTDKVVTLINECRDMSLNILSPDINRCEYHFAAFDSSTVSYGLQAIKGVGQGAIEVIIEERKKGGAFQGLFDFCRRLDSRRVNRRVIESLIRSGAMDCFGATRAALMTVVTNALQAADQHSRDRRVGQDDMFGGATTTDRVADLPEYPESELLMGEKDTLGLYLTGHPIDAYTNELTRFVTSNLAGLKPTDKGAIVAGLIVTIRTMNTRRGRMAIVTLDDRSARIEAVIYSDLFSKCRETLVKDRLVVIRGQVALDDVTGLCAVTAEDVWDLDAARSHLAKQLIISISGKDVNNGFVHDLQALLDPFSGDGTPVTIEYSGTDAAGTLRMGKRWHVRPTSELLNRFADCELGVTIEVCY